MPKKRIYTIKDIAKRADVSSATVSNALNNKGRLNEKTKKRIERIAENLSYKPNIIARALTMKKTKIVGVFVPEINNEYYSQVFSGMEQIANEYEYTIILIDTQYDLNKEQREVEKLIRLFAEGLIFISGSRKFDHIVKSNSNGIPTVCVDREIENRNKMPSILIDNVKAMRQACEYLYNHGHKLIGYFGHLIREKEIITTIKRYKGYLDGLRNSGLSFRKNNVFINNDPSITEIDSFYNIYKNYIYDNLKKISATAIITQNDFMAIALIRALKDFGIRIPEDISIMGFDNIAMSQFIDPPLTTTEQPKRELGKQGMKLLLDIINKKNVDNKIRFLETSIVERCSVQKYES